MTIASCFVSFCWLGDQLSTYKFLKLNKSIGIKVKDRVIKLKFQRYNFLITERHFNGDYNIKQ
jgi:hypothetical protein